MLYDTCCLDSRSALKTGFFFWLKHLTEVLPDISNCYTATLTTRLASSILKHFPHLPLISYTPVKYGHAIFLSCLRHVQVRQS
jgi:hypothetical protein